MEFKTVHGAERIRSHHQDHWRNRYAVLCGVLAALCVLCGLTPAATAQLGVDAQNAIVTENALAGNPPSEWDIAGAGDLTIQGFATQISVNKGETVHFKIKTNAPAYSISIYRLGYYSGNGARRVGTGVITAALPQSQPNPLTDATTGLIDCGNWTESANWPVPATAVSGIYLAKLIRSDNQGASHIVFIVRDDASTSPMFFQTSDATWQAYNAYGGNSLYLGTAPFANGHAAKVSYNRPFITRNGGGGSGQAAQDWLFNSEYPMVRFLEANGYDLSYTTNVDTDRRGSLIKNHKVFLSIGHDEYWSAAQRANVESARDAGVHLGFFSGNEVYWKTRFENSIDGSGTAYRTLVCYKEGTLGENVCGGKCDPLANVWTGLWRDGCSFGGADGCKPENALTGQISWNESDGGIVVPAAYKNLRFWRNTSVASLASGQSVTLPAGTLGYEWDQQQYAASYPTGRILLSNTVQNGGTHQLTLVRKPSGALVFGAGTIQWTWGLDSNHDRGNTAPSLAMQQATVNLFADMGAQPVTLQSGLVAATASTDVTAPVSTIAAPLNGANVTVGSNVTVSGTASDTGGTLAGIEVSTDGGTTWKPATGTTTWSYTWVPATAGNGVIKCRGYDDSGNMQVAGTAPSASAITVTAGVTVNCPCSAFLPTDAPALDAASDGAPIEVGVKFRSAVKGYVTKLRFYKGSLNVGTHLGHLWSSTGTQLTEATYTGESASGWQNVTLSPPVSITANTTYVASVHTTGYYSSTTPFFTSGVSRGPLRLLADGEDGANGLYDYGTSKLPVSNFQSSNYWVDVVFDTTIGADVTPPVVVANAPSAGTSGVPVATTVSATFNEAMAAASFTTSTVTLRDAAAALVSATVSYDASTRTVTLKPSAALAYSTVYTATLKGGAAPRLTDVAGNALAADFTWSFTTTAAPPPPPTDGPGGPVLVISSPSNPFSRYPVEMLRAEGFNLFAAKDISTVTSTVLNSYDVAVLGEMALTSAQVTLLTNWVTAGGTLIALRPSKSLTTLLGLTDAAATLSNQYLKVANSGAGTGIESQTMQFHGTADLYTLNGATAVATLYSNATTATSNPAVTVRSVGASGGQAIAFTFDLARSIVYTRQGNPAWAGQERDGTAPRRSDDLFFGASATDPQTDWVDLSKVAIPQADEQQRLFANLIVQANLHRKPLPRFWYFPKGKKAVVVMTGDDHGDAGMAPRFDIYRQASPINCSEPDWDCVRATGYEYVSTGFTDAQAAFYNSLGFEVAVHITTNCADFTPASFDNNVSSQMGTFATALPSVPLPTTNRTHCIAWSDWSSAAEIEASRGIRLDTNYYYWPATWVQDRPGMFTGSGIPMRFAKSDGTLIDCYQVTTQMTDESNQSYPMTSDSLLVRALDVRGYYGAFCANMHFDNPNHPGSNAIVASALARGVPVVSSKQMLDWLDGRNGSSFSGVAQNGTALSFTIAVATGARNLQAMLPMTGTSARLSGLSRGGVAVAFTTQTIKGIEYAFFPADPGNYTANYGLDSTPPVISAVGSIANANGTATINWTTNEAATSRIDYGTTVSTLNLNVSAAALVTAHSITLTGLNGSTAYYFRLTSADAAGNSTTSPASPALPRGLTTVADVAPVAAATGTPRSGAAPLSVSFSGAASTDANNDSLTFAWAFGDGGTGTGRLASHVFTAAGNFAVILTVKDGRGGSDTASVAISTISAEFPTTTVLDNFNRADGAPGANWADMTGNFAIASNALTQSSGGDVYVEWTSPFAASQEVYVTLSAITAAATEHNLMLKTQGTTWSAGHLEVSYNATTSKVTVYSFTAPTTWKLFATFSGVTFTAGQQFGARVLSDGTVQVFKNGTRIGTTSVASWGFAAQGGRIGLSCAQATVSRFDNFGGGTYISGAPAVTDTTAVLDVDPTGNGSPVNVSLSNPFPNPSHTGTTMSLALPREADVTMTVLDIQGRAIWSAPPRRYAAGRWTLRWDGMGSIGHASTGVYMVRVRAGSQVMIRRVAVLR